MSDDTLPPTPSFKDYTQDPTYMKQAEANATPIFDVSDPIKLFEEWMIEARASEPNDANAMSLATVDASNMPDVRMVLLKGVDERGFVFYTNAESAKGEQLSQKSCAALCFHWKSLRRQVRVRGHVEKVSKKESDHYFSRRARGSQIGAWASEQSRIAESRDEIEIRIREVEAKFEGKDIPRPPHWYGWRVIPEVIEFWRDRPFRLHDRLQFTRKSGEWAKVRLYP